MTMGQTLTRALVIVALACGIAAAQPAPGPAADHLRDANAAAATFDWPRVTALVDPLFRLPLARNDLAEAHRLAGLAAYFLKDRPTAELHFVAYLQIDLDGHLDPSLYPPDVVSFFQDVEVRHAAELRARRPKQKRYWILNLIPPGGQLQNGERTKAIVVGGMLGGFALAHGVSFLLLRSWCTKTTGPAGSGLSCDTTHDRSSTATQLRVLNIAGGIGLIATYLYGVYDGVHGYRRRSGEQTIPYLIPATGGGVVGIGRTF
jgi:hypothetical protein